MKHCLGSMPPCDPHHYRPTIKMASNVVDIELEKPIDISQMIVHECSVKPIETHRGLMFERKSELKAYDGDSGDEIIIQITRISPKRPKIENV
jgi:hypothetical protein